MRSSDVLRGGKPGPLHGKTPKEIYFAHHNLNADGKPAHGVEHIDKGCECDDCKIYLKSQKEPAA
ncbi:MAG TPA: hypothetical protein VFB79_07675 [Candidatus Angelobacter sp.]|nr:hypothetical protein [Candidatus Angelobacter sp.]